MTVGLSVAKANAELNVYRNTANPAIANVYVQLHDGDPGAAGTDNVSAVTTRNEATFNEPANGSMTLDELAAYSMTATETISHISFWDADTAGNFLESAALTAGVPVIAGSSLTWSALTMARSPIAAAA